MLNNTREIDILFLDSIANVLTLTLQDGLF
jgi:hypothetical protein